MTPRRGTSLDLGALSGWAPELAETFVSLASDIAVVIDPQGVVRNVSQGGAQPLAPRADEWIGHAWADTVTGDTRAKIEQLLQEAQSGVVARRREVNHTSLGGDDVPVAYTAIRLGEHGPILAVGRDLRAIASMQQRFLDAQRDLEKGYWQARRAESRYRLLFHAATDAVMLVDPHHLQILESNQAASRLFDLAPEQLLGRPVGFGFESRSRPAVDELLSSARASGRQAEIRARLAGKVTPVSVAATPFRTDDGMRLLVRVRTADPVAATDWNVLARLVDGASDAVVVTDAAGRVTLANPAFLQLVGLGEEREAKGRMLSQWLAQTEAAAADVLRGLVDRVRQAGIVRDMPCLVRREHAPAPEAVLEVELCATLLTEGDQESIGLTMHRVSAVPAVAPQGVAAVLHAVVEQVSDQLGTLPLQQLLREGAAAMERHLIGLALERAGHDAVRAAALLGISPASLAQRRRRFGPAGASGGA